MEHIAVRRVIGEGDVFKAYIRGGGRFSGSSLLGKKRQTHGLVLQLDDGIGSHHAAITHVPGVDEVGHGREACADEEQGVDQRVRLHMAPRALIRGDGDGKGIAKPREKLQDHVFQHGDAKLAHHRLPQALALLIDRFLLTSVGIESLERTHALHAVQTIAVILGVRTHFFLPSSAHDEIKQHRTSKHSNAGYNTYTC